MHLRCDGLAGHDPVHEAARLLILPHAVIDPGDCIQQSGAVAGLEAVGNLPRATRLGFENISTIQFDPIGWTGAKLDMDIAWERGRVRDPLTGVTRDISNTHDRWAELTFRHDVPHSQFAWGAGLSYEHYGLAYYLDEINQSWEGPYASAFVELKDVKGLKVNFQVFNINDGHVRYYRTVYSGYRNNAPVVFLERQHQRVGPIFTLTIKGSF